MFTTIEKYQKAFLIFITVLITAAFGLGGVCFTIFDPNNFTSVASIGELGKSYSKTELASISSNWKSMYQFAQKMSPKAKAALSKPNFQNFQQYQQYQQYFGASYLNNQIETPSVWDQLYCLNSNAFEIESRGDIEAESSTEALSSQEILQKKINFYLRLSAEDKKKIEKPLTQNDVWKCLILVEEAKNYGIKVSQEEIDDIARHAIKTYGGEKDFKRELSRVRMLYSDFRKMTKNALMINKLINTKASTIKVRMKEVYDNIKENAQEYQIDYTLIDIASLEKNTEEDYNAYKVKFYNKKQKEDPTFFETPSNVSFEYLHADKNTLLEKITVTQDEIKKFTEENIDDYSLDEEQNLEDVIQESLGQITEDFKKQKAKKQAQDIISQIRIKLSSLKGDVHLDSIAKSYNLNYGQYSDLEKGKFLDLKDIGTATAQNQLYGKMKEGDISFSFEDRTESGYFFVRVTNISESSSLSEDDIKNDDDAFLTKYYEKNKSDFGSNDEYRLAYVIADYREIEKSLIPTTNDLKKFYEKYKDELYKKDDKYDAFEEVKDDVSLRAINLLKTRTLQKIAIVQKKCKSLGEDINIGPAVESLGKRVGLKYYESTLLTADQIKKENIPNDENFSPTLNEDSKVSNIVETKNGKYFYIVLEQNSKDSDNFAEIRENVKRKFLQTQSKSNAENFGNDFISEYKKILNKSKENIEAYYEVKMASAKETESLEKEKKNKLNDMAQEILKALTLKYSLPYKSTASFSDISEIAELKSNSSKINDELKKATVGELSIPLEDSNKGSLCIFLLQSKKYKSLGDISQKRITQMRQGLWEIKYNRKLREEFLNFEKLSKKFKLNIDDSIMDISEEEAKELEESEKS